MWKEFKTFIMRGNVLDLAVGIIIGAAFGKIVDSLVNDLVMPVVGRFTGGLEFTNYFTALAPIPAGVPHTLEAVKKAGVPVVAWGSFVNVTINFVILAFIVFLIARSFIKEAPAAPMKDCPRCTMSIPAAATRCPHCTTELSPARA